HRIDCPCLQRGESLGIRGPGEATGEADDCNRGAAALYLCAQAVDPLLQPVYQARKLLRIELRQPCCQRLGLQLLHALSLSTCASNSSRSEPPATGVAEPLDPASLRASCWGTLKT